MQFKSQHVHSYHSFGKIYIEFMNNQNNNTRCMNTSNKQSKRTKPSIKAILGLLTSSIVLYAVAFLIRDKYNDLGGFLCLVSYFPYMLFAFEIFSNKKAGMFVCAIGWFIMMFLWSDYAIFSTPSLLPAFGILGLCSFGSIVAYLLMYRVEA